MYYINANQASDGGYNPPQTTPFKNALSLPDEFLELYIECAGFVTLTHENGVITSVSPNTEALEAWKAQQTAEIETENQNSSEPVTWAALDAAYNEGRDAAYDE